MWPGLNRRLLMRRVVLWQMRQFNSSRPQRKKEFPANEDEIEHTRAEARARALGAAVPPSWWNCGSGTNVNANLVLSVFARKELTHLLSVAQ